MGIEQTWEKSTEWFIVHISDMPESYIKGELLESDATPNPPEERPRVWVYKPSPHADAPNFDFLDNVSTWGFCARHVVSERLGRALQARNPDIDFEPVVFRNDKSGREDTFFFLTPQNKVECRGKDDAKYGDLVWGGSSFTLESCNGFKSFIFGGTELVLHSSLVDALKKLTPLKDVVFSEFHVVPPV